MGISTILELSRNKLLDLVRDMDKGRGNPREPRTSPGVESPERSEGGVRALREEGHQN